mgnify:CR=1 FL=1
MFESVIERNARASKKRLVDLRADLEERLDAQLDDHARSRITIYATGSLARLEASTHSDLDAFFMCLVQKIKTGSTLWMR